MRRYPQKLGADYHEIPSASEIATREKGSTWNRKSACLLLGYASGVTVDALDEMNVVRTLNRFERSVHGLHVKSAIGELWMASGARRPRFQSVPLVTCETTESLVHANGSAIVARAYVHRCDGCVALVAERLANIRADVNRTIAVVHDRKRKPVFGHILEFPAVE